MPGTEEGLRIGSILPEQRLKTVTEQKKCLSAKVLRQEHAWSVQGMARRGGQCEQAEGAFFESVMSYVNSHLVSRELALSFLELTAVYKVEYLPIAYKSSHVLKVSLDCLSRIRRCKYCIHSFYLASLEE